MDRKNELRHKVAYEIANNCFPAPPFEYRWAHKIADSILSLIDSQRCVWTDKNGHRSSGCGKEHAYLLTQFDKYCRYCGRKIEVKDGQG